MKIKSPAKSLQRATFCVLAGVSEARLDGDEIAGRFEPSPQALDGTKRKRLFENFTNWLDSPQDILRFTRKYGPLDDRPSPGGPFRFRLAEWRANQEGFRFLWALVQAGESTGALARREDDIWESLIEFRSDGGWLLPVDRSDEWSYANATLSYRAANLWRLLVFDLLACPRERLRKCARPDCKNPYFVARHLKQRYCSDLCAATGRAQWKRNWWTEHGKEWRRKRQQHDRERR